MQHRHPLRGEDKGCDSDVSGNSRAGLSTSSEMASESRKGACPGCSRWLGDGTEAKILVQGQGLVWLVCVAICGAEKAQTSQLVQVEVQGEEGGEKETIGPRWSHGV